MSVWGPGCVDKLASEFVSDCRALSSGFERAGDGCVGRAHAGVPIEELVVERVTDGRELPAICWPFGIRKLSEKVSMIFY